MTKEMDTFLDGEGTADVADPAIVEAEPVADAGGAGDGNTTPPPVADGPDAVPEPKPEDPSEDEPEDTVGLRKALVAERGKRNDWKGQAERTAGELTATKAQLEAALKAPPAPAQPAPAADPPAAVVVPNPLEDPTGYHAHTQRMMFNERLNLSEAMFREGKDAADIDAKLAAFKTQVEANPSLRAELSRQPHPYKWAYDQGAKALAMSEIGTDPTAYKARVKAELLAELEAENAGAAQVIGVPAVRLPRSLATAPSSAPRTQAIEEAPTDLDEILGRRKRG